MVDPIKSRWFNTVAFRQAVAIDRQTIIMFRGLGELQHSSHRYSKPLLLPFSKEGLSRLQSRKG